MNIVFMGTPDFAKESLEALCNAGHKILAVVTNPDKPQGRGMKLTASPVKQFAIEKGLEVYQPSKIKNNNEFIEKIKSLSPDLLCVVAYGKILPKELLEIPSKGAINVHGSLLPKYRGAAPIQWAVINGDATTGITTMYMNEGMDTGDMILKKEVDILPDETTGELWNRLSKIGADLLVETTKKIEKGEAPREKQPLEGTMAPMLSKDMAKIDWNKSAIEIKNLIRGLNPILGAYSYIEDKKIKIWRSDDIDIKDFINKFEHRIGEQEISKLEPGTIIISDPKQGLYIKTNDGILSVLEIQGENAKKMDITSFLRGNKLTEYSIFK